MLVRRSHPQVISGRRHTGAGVRVRPQSMRKSAVPVLTALCLAMVPAVALAPSAAAADGDNLIDLASQHAGGTDWVRGEDRIITVVDTDGDGMAFVVVEGSAMDGSRIVVAENTKAIIELNGATIDLAGAGMRGPHHGIALSDGSVVEVQLAEGSVNRLVGAYSNGVGGAGISVPGGSSLVITALGDGSGALDAIGWVAQPGIGGQGGTGGTGGEIQIDGGNITSFGGDSAAGLGGGYRGKSAAVTIRGGNITAKGGNGVAGRNGGAGIGSGHGGFNSPITINGGTIHAEGVFGGAGIGGGYAASTNSTAVNVLITGGDITAIGTGPAAGIGSSSLNGGQAKATNLIVATGADTYINAVSGRTVEEDGKNAIAAIGGGEGDGTRTETFIIVGGQLMLNNQEIAQNLTLQAASGNTGAIAITIPDSFKNVPEQQVRLVRTLNPDASFVFQTTADTKPINFSTNGFDAEPAAIAANSLASGAATVTFNPQDVNLPLFDTGPVEPVFWEGQSPLLLVYVGVGLAAALITLVIGASSARSRMTRHRAITY